VDTIEITITVSKDFAEDAEEFGLLDSETIANLLQSELDDRIIKMVDTEVKAFRSEHRHDET
jgi:hypothetical protein